MTESHFHVCTAPYGVVPISDVRYDSYDESIGAFLALGTYFFSELREDPYDQTIEQALEVTRYGLGRGAYIGSPSLMVYWMRCEEETHPGTPSWN